MSGEQISYPYQLVGFDDRGTKIAEFGDIPTYALAKQWATEWVEQFEGCETFAPTKVRIVRFDGYGTEDDDDLFSTKFLE
jgi:hypothetical protein